MIIPLKSPGFIVINHVIIFFLMKFGEKIALRSP